MSRAVEQPRGDIQALRAVAVGLVVVFHLWPGRLTGGYVGVDVFFVISGYLITGHLLRDIERSGRVRLGRFWMRRIRRLMPSALLVLLLTTVATLLVVPEQYWRQFLRQVVASTLYVENWALAGESVDYLAADSDPSPVQHYWSLSVEEQFYILLPLLLLVVTLVVRGRWRRPAVLGVLGAVTAASLAWSVHLTAVSPPTAYFVTTTRLWELGVGALVSVAPVLASRRLRIGVSSAGLAAVLASAVLITEATAFPGWVALGPVLGTAAVIWAGATDARWDPVRLLDTPAVRWVGDRSYAIYLWHWPLIVLVPFALDLDHLGRLHKAGVLVATALLSWASSRWVENPIRFATAPALSTVRLVLPVTAAAMALVVASAAAGLVVDGRRAERAALAVEQVQQQTPRCFGAMSVGFDGSRCTNAALGTQLVPPPAQAAEDDSGGDAACWTGEGERRLRLCQLGDPAATTRVLAVGDSHSNALVPAYREMARRTGWSVEAAGKNGCYLTMTSLPKAETSELRACDAWRDAVLAHVREGRYDLVVVTHAAGRGEPRLPSRSAREAAIRDGMARTWAVVLGTGARILAIRDDPAPTKGTVDCVARAGTAANERCSLKRLDALGRYDGSRDAARGLRGVHVADYSDVYCDRRSCSTVIGSVVVYRDDVGHLTGTFARTLGPRITGSAKYALR